MFRNIWEYALVWIIIFAPFMGVFSIIAYLFYWRMSNFFKHMEKNFDQFLIYQREMKLFMKKHNEHHRTKR